MGGLQKGTESIPLPPPDTCSFRNNSITVTDWSALPQDSGAEVLTPTTSECDPYGHRIFAGLIKLK